MDKLHTRKSMKEEDITEEVLRKIKYLRANYDPNGTEIGRKNDLEKMLKIRKLIEQLHNKVVIEDQNL